MAEWNHAICDACYQGMYPGRHPVRVKDTNPTTCCYCGRKTVGGIYLRDDPKEVLHPRGHGR